MTQIIEEEPDEAGLESLLAFIRDARGFDFTGYKRSSLTRRIHKRMHEAGSRSYEDYRDRLETSAEEFGSLFNTILINVTSFSVTRRRGPICSARSCPS
jgi:two-component system, chemotaxis family, CheB/CheR fusion protein